MTEYNVQSANCQPLASQGDAGTPGEARSEKPQLNNDDIALFRRRFFHVDSYYAEMFRYKSGERAGEIGYSPACSNRWNGALCLLSQKDKKGNRKGSCRVCQKRELIPVSDEIIKRHIIGKKGDERTIGTYLVSPQGTVNLCVIDVDVNKEKADQIEVYRERVKEFTRLLYHKAQHYGLNPVLEFSGSKGYHLWIFFEAAIPATKAQLLGNWLAEQIEIPEDCHLEVNPKQGDVNDRFGNLVKVPLGVHLKTRNRCFFVNPETLEGAKDEQVERLRAIVPVELEHIESLFEINEIHPYSPTTSKNGNGGAASGDIPCLNRMWGGVGEGCRDAVAFRLACKLREDGFPPDTANISLNDWDQKHNDPPLGSAVISEKVESAYSNGYKFCGYSDPLIKPFCDSSCRIYRYKRKADPVIEEEVRNSSRLTYLSAEHDTLIFCRAGLEYRCSRNDRDKTPKAMIELRQGERTIHKDYISPALHRNRKRFADECKANDDSLDPKEIIQDLLDLDNLIPQHLVNLKDESAPEPEEPKVEPKTLDEVKQVFRTRLYMPDTGAVEVLLGATVANHITGDPVWPIFIGPPGAGKTETIMSISRHPKVRIAAVMNEASLLSGTPSKDRTDDSRGGLLCEIGEFGILVIKDLGAILAAKHDTRGPLLQALRDIYDGRWVRNIGADGGRTLQWTGKMGLIAGATPSIDAHHAVIAALGERFAYYRMPEVDEQELADKAVDEAGDETDMRDELSKVVAGLFQNIKIPERPPKLTVAEKKKITALARFAVRCRSAVERDMYSSSREIILVPGAEMPTRFVKMLITLLGGLLAIGCEAPRAWQLIEKVALDSMPKLRRQVFDVLRESNEAMETAEVAKALGYATNTSRRALEDLACYGIVTRDIEKPQGAGRPADQWELTPSAKALYAAATAQLDWGLPF